MNKLNRVQKILIGIIITCVVIGSSLVIHNGSLQSNVGYDVFALLKYSMIDHPLMTIKDWTSDFTHLWSVKQQNDELRNELSQNPSYKAMYEEERAKNIEYEKALEINAKEDMYELKWANVIARDATHWNNEITIDKGKKDGIKEGLAVQSVYGMIGKVSSVSQFTSKVKLLTSEDKTNSVSIKINLDKKHSVDGILQSYDVNLGQYVIYLYDDNDKVEKGMQIITSGMGKSYPSGLLIGTVERVQALSNQVGSTIYASPVEDFQEFTIVGIVQSHEEE
ncbi:MAG: rod shape-determining protein MreC [Longicatena sp.]|nr:rod shape-determining protein MreC [Longicatena sp.]